MILRNVELHWAKLDPANVDMGFDGTKPQWNTKVIIRDRDQKAEFIEMGLNPKTEDDESGVFYSIRVMKNAVQKNGKPASPVVVVGPDKTPIADVNSIGNGTLANVKLRTFEWTFNGKSGIGNRLEAIQIVKLVEYAGKGVADEDDFDLLEVPTATEGFEDLDVY